MIRSEATANLALSERVKRDSAPRIGASFARPVPIRVRPSMLRRVMRTLGVL